MRSHLHRGGRNSGHDGALPVDERDDVAEGKHLRVARQAQVRCHLEATGAVGFEAQGAGERMRRHAGRPDDIGGADRLGGERDLP